MPEGTFKEFMAEVDKHMEEISGLTHECLGDYMYYDAYESGEEPEDVARQVLAENEFPFEEGE